jgi:hypothetical protein
LGHPEKIVGRSEGNPTTAVRLAEGILVRRSVGVLVGGIVDDGIGAPVGLAEGLLMETNVGEGEED